MSLQKAAAYICLSCIAADLRKEKVDAERGILVLEVFFEFVNDSLQILGCLIISTNNANTA